MMRFAALLTVLVALSAGAAFAASPSPHPSSVYSHSVPIKLTNPRASNAQHSMSGQGCSASHINAAQVATNPTTGKPKAAPIVQIPLGGGGGGVAGATTRAQQTQACAQAKAR